jgi:hypothetical protein
MFLKKKVDKLEVIQKTGVDLIHVTLLFSILEKVVLDFGLLMQVTTDSFFDSGWNSTDNRSSKQIQRKTHTESS